MVIFTIACTNGIVFSFRTNWKNLNCALYEDAQKVSGEYKNISFLKCINVSDWLSERNPCFISFLSSATGVAINDSRTKKMNAFSHLIEQVLYTRKLNLVTPFSFKRNLIMYSITNSKTAVNLQSSWESSGSYTTVHDIVTSKVDPKNCPDGDVHSTIDNNQKVGMCTWKIREGSTVPLSIVQPLAIYYHNLLHHCKIRNF